MDTGEKCHQEFIVSPLAVHFCNFSGADISIVVRDALMQPVRKVEGHLKN